MKMPNNEPPDGRNENAEQPELHQQPRNNNDVTAEQRNNNDVTAEQRNGQQSWLSRLIKVVTHPMVKWIIGGLMPLYMTYIFIPAYGLYDVPKFEQFISNTECSYTQLCIKQDWCKKGGTPITDDMYNNTPILIPTSFEELNTKSTTTEKHGHTQITNMFPVDMEDASKRLFAITGEPGSGKTVYLETLRSYYIKQGLFPFLITFKRLDSMKNEKMNFPQFLLKCAGPGFKFRYPQTFVKWIRNNKKKIIILADGLDEHPYLIVESVYEIDIMESTTTPDQLISLLFYGAIYKMKEVKVLFTSRPSSILNLPQLARPDVHYSMNGFANQSLSGVLRNYNVTSDDADEILKFIENKGPTFVNFARNPFILALISLTYKTTSNQITSETTLTQLYEHAFVEMRRSLHSRGKWTFETEKEVDKFFYIYLFKKDKVTANDIKEYNHEQDRELKQRSKDLTLEKLESYSMLKVASERSSAYIEETDEIITPMHKTVMDFHIARHLVRSMEITTFKKLVEEEMYNLKDEDRWVMIRRFVSGLINHADVDTDKRRVVVEQYTKTWIEVTSDDSRLAGDNEREQAGILLGHLCDDLSEFNDEQVRFIKETIGDSISNLFVIMDNYTSIEGPTNCLRKMSPHKERNIVVGELGSRNVVKFKATVEDLPDGREHVPYKIENRPLFRGEGKLFSTMRWLVSDAMNKGVTSIEITHQALDNLEFTKKKTTKKRSIQSLKCSNLIIVDPLFHAQCTV